MREKTSTWGWPLVCAAATTTGMTIGLLLEGIADLFAAALLLTPTVLLAWKCRLKKPAAARTRR